MLTVPLRLSTRPTYSSHINHQHCLRNTRRFRRYLTTQTQSSYRKNIKKILKRIVKTCPRDKVTNMSVLFNTTVSTMFLEIVLLAAIENKRPALFRALLNKTPLETIERFMQDRRAYSLLMTTFEDVTRTNLLGETVPDLRYARALLRRCMGEEAVCALVDHLDNLGQTLLMEVAIKGYYFPVKLLLAFGANHTLQVLPPGPPHTAFQLTIESVLPALLEKMYQELTQTKNRHIDEKTIKLSIKKRMHPYFQILSALLKADNMDPHSASISRSHPSLSADHYLFLLENILVIGNKLSVLLTSVTDYPQMNNSTWTVYYDALTHNNCKQASITNLSHTNTIFTGLREWFQNWPWPSETQIIQQMLPSLLGKYSIKLWQLTYNAGLNLQPEGELLPIVQQYMAMIQNVPGFEEFKSISIEINEMAKKIKQAITIMNRRLRHQNKHSLPPQQQSTQPPSQYPSQSSLMLTPQPLSSLSIVGTDLIREKKEASDHRIPHPSHTNSVDLSTVPPDCSGSLILGYLGCVIYSKCRSQTASPSQCSHQQTMKLMTQTQRLRNLLVKQLNDYDAQALKLLKNPFLQSFVIQQAQQDKHDELLILAIEKQATKTASQLIKAGYPLTNRNRLPLFTAIDTLNIDLIKLMCQTTPILLTERDAMGLTPAEYLKDRIALIKSDLESYPMRQYFPEMSKATLEQSYTGLKKIHRPLSDQANKKTLHKLPLSAKMPYSKIFSLFTPSQGLLSPLSINNTTPTEQRTKSTATS